jgi:hypothetical protein
MSSCLYKINQGIIIQHIKDSSEDYINRLYNSLDYKLKEKITIEDIQQELIHHIFNIMFNSKSDNPTVEEIFDNHIIFGGKDYQMFLVNFISSFDNTNLKDGLSKNLLALCKYYDLL